MTFASWLLFSLESEQECHLLRIRERTGNGRLEQCSALGLSVEGHQRARQILRLLVLKERVEIPFH